MKVNFKKQFSKTGALVVTSAIAISLSIFAPLTYVKALDNKQATTNVITKIETGATITSDELFRALSDNEGQKIVEQQLSLGKNINYYTDIRTNNSLNDIELEVRLDKTLSDNVSVEYTGIKTDTSEYPIKFYYEYKLSESNDNLAKGIDVSSWQGTINWDETSKHIDFAIIRVMDAICRDSNGNFLLDEQFHRNMQECERLNIPVGVYWYSRATTEETARREANFVGQVLEGYTLEYPTYIDVECESQLNLDNQTLQNVITAANTEIAKYNLYPAIYINNTHAHRVDNLPYKLWLTSGETYNNRVAFNDFSQDDFPVYYTPTNQRTSYQYSSKGSVPGISGYIDLDYSLNNVKQEIANSPEYKTRSR